MFLLHQFNGIHGVFSLFSMMVITLQNMFHWNGHWMLYMVMLLVEKCVDQEAFKRKQRNKGETTNKVRPRIRFANWSFRSIR